MTSVRPWVGPPCTYIPLTLNVAGYTPYHGQLFGQAHMHTEKRNIVAYGISFCLNSVTKIYPNAVPMLSKYNADLMLPTCNAICLMPPPNPLIHPFVQFVKEAF